MPFKVPEIYLWHAIAVEFPIALLSMGLLAAFVYCFFKKPAWLVEVQSWFLWLGTALLWLALALGLVAEDEAPHVPMAWKTLNQHKNSAFWTVGGFSALALAWFFMRNSKAARWLPWLWLLAFVLLLGTGYHGGRLVFDYGMGVNTQ